MMKILLCKCFCSHAPKDDRDAEPIRVEVSEKGNVGTGENKEDLEPISLANGRVANGDIRKKGISKGDTIKLMDKNDWHELKKANKHSNIEVRLDPDKSEMEFKEETKEESEDGAIISVKVEVHSSSSGAGSGSDENLSSSDLSERSGDVDHDHEREPDPPEPEYEDIYQLREEAGHPAVQPPSHDQPSMTASTESGVSSASPSDLGHSEEEPEKLKVPTHHTLPNPNNNNNSRALKRVVSEPGGMGPPPPPPPPPAEEEGSVSAPPSPARSSRRASTNGEDATPLQAPPSPVVNPEPVVKPSEVLKALGARKPSVDSNSSGTPEAEQEGGKSSGPNLVNKQMVLPFVPPKFPSNAADSNSLIKPSEYLRSLGGVKTPAIVLTPVNNNTNTINTNLNPVPSGVNQEQSSEEDLTDTTQTTTIAPSVPAPPTPVGPPPPPLPSNTATLPFPTSQQTLAEAEKAKQLQQPLGAISIQDLNSVQLRRTDKMLAAKTLSAPPRAATLTHNGDAPFQTQKEDLIAELKMARDVPGIKKLKVERAKVEEKQEKEMLSEISRSLTANSFVEKIPDKDATGNPIPEWKRQMMAKKAAERARKELEQQIIKEAEEKRLQSIPAWKRQLMAKKEETETKKTGVYTPRVVEDKRPGKALANKDECWHQQQQKQQMNGIESVPADTTAKEDTSNKENKTPAPAKTDDIEEDPAPIMPWRAQLRKTNSKLSLME